MINFIQLTFFLTLISFLFGCMEQNNESVDMSNDMSSLNADADLPQEPLTCDTNIKCPEGLYCVHSLKSCEGPGQCQPAKIILSGDYRPVCGCDGLTYGHEDTAHSNGVAVAKQGVCQRPAPQSCGGMYEDRFGGFYCASGDCIHYDGDECGGTDASGSCEARPDVCSMASQPVCGCDKKTYLNECIRVDLRKVVDKTRG